MIFRRGKEHHKATHYRCGDFVTVRSLEEIFATLDADGALDGMPFMPEMARFCNRTFRVVRRAERTCVEGEDGPRRMINTVFLEGLRCDGSAHDGCQRGCLLFWKEAWLKPASEAGTSASAPSPRADASQLPIVQGDRYYCQSTELAKATSQLEPGDLRYYWKDFWAGEASLRRVAHILWLTLLGFLWRRWRGQEYYGRPAGQQTRTASVELGLKPGEIVEVKSEAEIRATLDSRGRNRGLSFEPEMLYLCGRRFRVQASLKTMISETTGQMIRVSNTVILEGATCEGICIKNCPRAHHFFWREAWLKRVHEGAPAAPIENCAIPCVQSDLPDCAVIQTVCG
jgi:hypothetical protein